MTFTDLDQAREDAGYRISTYTQELGDADDDRSAALFAISWEHRQLAICKLLQDADVAGYQTGLRRSALTWMQLLRSGAQVPPRMLIGSAWSCLAGIVAANDFILGRALAARFPQSCDLDREYADAYYPIAMLSHVSTHGVNSPGIAEVCDQWEKAVDGELSSELTAWRALAEKDNKGFHASFRNYANSRMGQMNGYRKAFTCIRTIAATEGGLFIDGLALLQVARARGMELPVPSPMCPRLALVPAPANELSPDAWQLLDP